MGLTAIARLTYATVDTDNTYPYPIATRLIHSGARRAQACARHSLSRAALTTAGAPIWLLDAFSQLVIYYAPAAPPGLPFPPPPSSALRRAVNALRASRRITPTLRMLRGGCASGSHHTPALHMHSTI